MEPSFVWRDEMPPNSLAVQSRRVGGLFICANGGLLVIGTLYTKFVHFDQTILEKP
jgi:hypothetical protein